MAEFLVRNSLNPNDVVKFGITLQKIVIDDSYSRKWVVCIATDAVDVNGARVKPEYITITSLDTLDDEVAAAVSRLANKIAWGPAEDDYRGPVVENFSPSEPVASIDSVLSFTLRDILPSTGIDIDSLSVKVNGVEVKNQLKISGTPYEYDIVWDPAIRYYR